MTTSSPLSDEQIQELVSLARFDEPLWAALKDLEVNQVHGDGSPKIPSMGMLVEELVRQKYGINHGYYLGGLIVRLRRELRLELGLPV